MECFAPRETMMFSRLYSSPLSRLNLAMMAFFSSGEPGTGVYFVYPSSSAFLATALIWSGVSKSGSPAPHPTTHKDVRPLHAGEIDQQAAERGDLDVPHLGGQALQHSHALRRGEEGVFPKVQRHRDDHPREDPGGPLDDVQVPVRGRIERPGVYGDGSHRFSCSFRPRGACPRGPGMPYKVIRVSPYLRSARSVHSAGSGSSGSRALRSATITAPGERMPARESSPAARPTSPFPYGGSRNTSVNAFPIALRRRTASRSSRGGRPAP